MASAGSPRRRRRLPATPLPTPFRARLLLPLAQLTSVATLVWLALPEQAAATSKPPRPATATAGGARTGVLIHGCHLGASRWKSIMWGDERRQRLGRLPHGARLAWEERACVVVLGTGASERDGVLEGRYALEYLTTNWNRLGEFHEAFLAVDLEEMRMAVEPTLVAEVRSKNTRQELLEAGRIFRKAKCDRIILVSSPTHLPRCLRDACALWLEPPLPDNPRLSVGRPRIVRDPATRTLHADRKTSTAAVAEASTDRGGKTAHLEAPRDNLPRESGTSSVGPREPLSSRKAVGVGEEASVPDATTEDDNNDKIEKGGWRPVIMASPSGTSYANFGPDDVAIVEPPHRPDRNRASFRKPQASLSARELAVDSPDNHLLDEEAIDTVEDEPPLLHELVGLALQLPRANDERFRKEFQELLRRSSGAGRAGGSAK